MATKNINDLVKEYGPQISKFGQDALKLIKSGVSATQIKIDIEKQKGIIKLCELEIGKIFHKKNLKSNNKEINAQLAKIAKCEEIIDKNERSLKAQKYIKKK